MNFTREGFNKFRVDFQKAVKELETKHNVIISMGNISYNDTTFNTKLTVLKKNPNVKSSSNLYVGKEVKINHPKVKDRIFIIKKINNKSVTVFSISDTEDLFRVSRSMVIDR